MPEKDEIILATILCIFIVLATAYTALSKDSDKITSFFSRYNPKQAEEFAEIVKETAKMYGIKPSIIAAIIVHESGVRPYAISKGGDYGLMQVRWKIHRKSYPELKTAKDLLNPRTNVRIGTEIFARYYAQKKNVRNALIRYNGGSASFARRVLKTIKRLEQ